MGCTSRNTTVVTGLAQKTAAPSGGPSGTPSPRPFKVVPRTIWERGPGVAFIVAILHETVSTRRLYLSDVAAADRYSRMHQLRSAGTRGIGPIAFIIVIS